MVFGDLQLLVLGNLHQRGICPLRQIEAIHHIVQHQVQLLLPAQIEQLLHLDRQRGVGFVIWDIEQLFYGVLLAVVGIQLDAHFPLMPSAVHVPVDGELHIAAFVHVQNLDGMPVVHGPGIRVFPVEKAEDNRQLIVGHIVAEQLARGNKHDHIPVFTLRHGHIGPCDAQQNFVV